MDRLPKEIWWSFFKDKDHYMQFRQRWSWLCNSPDAPKLDREHYLLYMALRGRDWRRGFTPVTNPKKLQNGGYDNWGLVHAWWRVVRRTYQKMEPFALFDGLVTEDMLDKVRKYLVFDKQYQNSYKAENETL